MKSHMGLQSYFVYHNILAASMLRRTGVMMVAMSAPVRWYHHNTEHGVNPVRMDDQLHLSLRWATFPSHTLPPQHQGLLRHC